MATAKKALWTFSSCRGENVCLSHDLMEASWYHSFSGNYIYASQCLQQNVTNNIEVNGSGHVDIGIVTLDPQEISREKRHPSFRRMNEVKVHKRAFTIHMKLQNNQVMSSYNGDEYKINLDPGKSAWIAIYPKFGEICAVIKSQTSAETSVVPFSRTTGYNIRLAEGDKKAFTISKCPAAICFPTCQLNVKQQAVFLCTPVIENDKKPSRFHLKIMVYKHDPETLKEDFKGAFSTHVQSRSEPPWCCIDCLERDKCDVRVRVVLADERNIVCSTDRGYRKQMSLTFDATAGLWLIFELYRVSLRIVDVKPFLEIKPDQLQGERTGSVASGASGDGNDEPDSIIPNYGGNENEDVFQPNNLGYRPEMSHIDSRNNQQEDGASGSSSGFSALNEGISNIKQSVRELHNKFDAMRQNSDPRDVEMPEALSPTTNKVELNFRKKMVQLKNDLNADDIIDHLYQETIISKSFYDKIRDEIKKCSSKEANRSLLGELEGKRVDRNVFEKILIDTEQEHLIQLFFSDDTETKTRGTR